MSRNAETYQDLRLRGGIADLSGRAILFLKGADRVRYLNGQVTSNVSALATGQSQPACVTTAKGRLCAEIMITSLADSLVIDADPALRESLQPRLERYIVADDVELCDGSDDWRIYHFLPAKHETLEAMRGTALDAFAHMPVRRFGCDGMDFLLPAAEAASLIAPFTGAHALIDAPLAETLRIEAGIPRWGYELGEDTLPPEAGLDRTHIDYRKGCYIGQEVISRLKSVGHVNRQLTGFVSENGSALLPGMTVFDGASGNPAGILTSATHSFALEKPIALGYLKRGSPSDGLIARSAESNGAEVRVVLRTLPFVS